MGNVNDLCAGDWPQLTLMKQFVLTILAICVEIVIPVCSDYISIEVGPQLSVYT